MSRQIKGLLYFFITDIRYSLMVFWSILLGVLVLSLAISYFLLGVEDATFYFGFPFATYFYCAILGFMTVKESIPFSLKLGATRKNMFISIGIYFLFIAFSKAVLANTIQSIVGYTTNRAGLSTFNFLHPASLIQDTWLTRVVIDTSLLFFLLAIMFLLGLFFYRAGLIGGGVVLGAILVTTLAGIANGWIFEFFMDLFQNIRVSFFYQLFAASIFVYGLSIVFLRKITIVKTK